MSIKETTVGRILARADNPTVEAPELDWINSEVRLGKSFGRASRDLQAQIACGRMIVVRTIKPRPKTKRRPMRAIPIVEARSLAEQYGYDQVIVISRRVGKAGGEHVTTYGRDKANCDVAARIGNLLKHKIMGWPENV